VPDRAEHEVSPGTSMGETLASNGCTWTVRPRLARRRIAQRNGFTTFRRASSFVSHRKPGVALDDLLDQLRSFPRRPCLRRMANTVAERSTIRSRSARDRARNANKLGLDRVGTGRYHGIPMPTHIDKLQMRCVIRIPHSMSRRDIAGTLILKRTLDPMLQCQVDG